MPLKLFVDAVDVHTVTRYSMGHCRRILRKIKLLNNKSKHQKVTLDELASYLGISSDSIRGSLS